MAIDNVPEVIRRVRRFYERYRTFRRCLGESRTQQSHRDASDVNYIVQRFQRTGELPKNPRGLEGRYEDVTGLQEELTEAFNKAQSNLDAFWAAQHAEAEAKAKETNRDDSWNAQEREDKAREAANSQTPKAADASPKPPNPPD